MFEGSFDDFLLFIRTYVRRCLIVNISILNDILTFVRTYVMYDSNLILYVKSKKRQNPQLLTYVCTYDNRNQIQRVMKKRQNPQLLRMYLRTYNNIEDRNKK